MSALRERLVNLCLELVDIPSVTGDETRIADHLENWARNLAGLARDDVIRHGNALIVGSIDSQKPCVALVGHTDTVPPTDDYAGSSVTADTVIGLGASDMKGSIAVMQALYEQLDLPALPFSLVLVLYDREEGPYDDNGLGPLLDNNVALHAIDLALAMEPTDNTLQLGCMGGIQARAVFTGRASHSARPWQGDNAIHKAGALLTRLAERPFAEVQVEGLTFRDAMSATMASGGRARNVIPDRFEININYRFPPIGDPQSSTERALTELKNTVGEVELDVYDVAPPGTVPVDNPILEHIRAQASLDILPKQAWTDVARLAAFGIDAINYGPGAGAQAHQRGEWINIDAMVESYQLLARALTTPLKGT